MKNLRLLLVVVAATIVMGCSAVSQMATQVAADQGVISQDNAESINRVVETATKTFADVTPEQEHYIGRAVAASLLATYPALDDPVANSYLNQLGQSIALGSERPETFGGYHFLLIDSDEINAFACPGGLILVSRELVACCRGEDELAAVLAHEIAHVAGKHGLRAIKGSRLTGALTVLAAEGARTFGSEDIAGLVDDLEGCIDDIAQSLVNSGYSRGLEQEADAAAVANLTNIGYNPRGLASMLEVMHQRWSPEGPGFMRTHPSPGDRLVDIEPSVNSLPALNPPPVRQQRFQTAMGQLLPAGA